MGNRGRRLDEHWNHQEEHSGLQQTFLTTSSITSCSASEDNAQLGRARSFRLLLDLEKLYSLLCNLQFPLHPYHHLILSQLAMPWGCTSWLVTGTTLIVFHIIHFLLSIHNALLLAANKALDGDFVEAVTAAAEGICGLGRFALSMLSCRAILCGVVAAEIEGG